MCNSDRWELTIRSWGWRGKSCHLNTEHSFFQREVRRESQKKSVVKILWCLDILLDETSQLFCCERRHKSPPSPPWGKKPFVHFKWDFLYQPVTPSGGWGGSIQNAMMSLRDLIEASFFVRSTSVDDADAPLFLAKSELKKREKNKRLFSY